MKTITLAALAAAAALTLAQPARATDPCDHYVVAGSFAVKANGVAYANLIGARLTYGNGDVPVLKPLLWHAYFGSFQTFSEADAAAARLRARVPGAYAKHDCTGVG